MGLLKNECEEVLMKLPCSIERLRQAKQLGLARQYKRCQECVSINLDEMPVEELASEPDILSDLLPHLKRAKQLAKQDEKARMDGLKRKFKELPGVMQGQLSCSGKASQGRLKGKRISTEVEKILNQQVEKILKKQVAEVVQSF